jgi:hypothetical protein
MPAPWSPDADPNQADWTKQTWDLPTDLPAFLKLLSRSEVEPIPREELKLLVQAFMRLPAARAMPAALKDSLLGEGLLELESAKECPKVPSGPLPRVEAYDAIALKAIRERTTANYDIGERLERIYTEILLGIPEEQSILALTDEERGTWRRIEQSVRNNPIPEGAFYVYDIDE